jgi:small multidrug resistance pump
MATSMTIPGDYGAMRLPAFKAGIDCGTTTRREGCPTAGNPHDDWILRYFHAVWQTRLGGGLHNIGLESAQGAASAAFPPENLATMNGYLLLALAIVAEVIATSSLKAAENFTRLWPSVLVVTGYVAAFWLLMQVMKTVPVGVAYAIWCGAGIVLVTLIAAVLYRQVPDLAAWIGIALIIGGVAVIQLFSRMSH